ncbi:MAG TPA: hypothetical protein VFP35_00120 [Candidatus Saccharimonadales bacterium]|nr:hypothetical protein [Candidatus Saccharimonadales bacterium]
MTEVALPPVDFVEINDRQAETKANTKTKIITAAALGALGVGAWYAESRGLVAGWPPPAHSFKHPWVGYYSAWGASRLFKRKKTSSAVALAALGDFASESVQDAAFSQDHFPFHWLELESQRHGDGNIDNLVDFACCMGGMALFWAQDNKALSYLRSRLLKLSSLRADQAGEQI